MCQPDEEAQRQARIAFARQCAELVKTWTPEKRYQTFCQPEPASDIVKAPTSGSAEWDPTKCRIHDECWCQACEVV